MFSYDALPSGSQPIAAVNYGLVNLSGQIDGDAVIQSSFYNSDLYDNGPLLTFAATEVEMFDYDFYRDQGFFISDVAQLVNSIWKMANTFYRQWLPAPRPKSMRR